MRMPNIQSRSPFLLTRHTRSSTTHPRVKQGRFTRKCLPSLNRRCQPTFAPILASTRQVYNLFQNLWNKFLGFFRKVFIQKKVQKCVNNQLYKVRRLHRRQTCFQTSVHRIGDSKTLNLQLTKQIYKNKSIKSKNLIKLKSVIQNKHLYLKHNAPWGT